MITFERTRLGLFSHRLGSIPVMFFHQQPDDRGGKGGDLKKKVFDTVGLFAEKLWYTND